MDVVITFHLDEEVTPELFLRKVAFACGKGGAIREGESLSVESVNPEFENHWQLIGYMETTLEGMFREPITIPSFQTRWEV